MERLCGQLAEFVRGLRTELADMRVRVQQERVEFGRLQAQLLAAIGQQYEAAMEAEKVRRQEQLQRLTVDHELEMDSLRKDIRTAAEAKDEAIQELKQVCCISILQLIMLLNNYVCGFRTK
jgi:hypothetical protein